MREERRMFKCWRYKINTYIHDIYDAGPDGKERLVYSNCSIKDQKKCNGMQSPDRRCPLIGHPDKRSSTDSSSSAV